MLLRARFFAALRCTQNDTGFETASSQMRYDQLPRKAQKGAARTDQLLASNGLQVSFVFSRFCGRQMRA